MDPSYRTLAIASPLRGKDLKDCGDKPADNESHFDSDSKFGW